MNYDILKKLCAVPATAGDEGLMTEFILKYFAEYSASFKTMPQVYSGAGFQDMVIAIFGVPRTAIFAHMDTVGYCVGYEKDLIKIGNPKAPDGTQLQGFVEGQLHNCTLKVAKSKSREDKKVRTPAEETYHYEGKANFAPGTPLSYAPDWKESKKFIKSAYLDDRLGVWNALQQCHNLEHGAVVFSTYEEVGGGGAQFAGRFLQENFGVQQALISDVTLLGKHIRHNKGVAISMRDRGIPRQKFVKRIIAIAKANGIPHQIEVEKAGGSDGISLQNSSWAWDWCFIGPPEDNYHQPGEKVAKDDIDAMLALYEVLMREL